MDCKIHELGNQKHQILGLDQHLCTTFLERVALIPSRLYVYQPVILHLITFEGFVGILKVIDEYITVSVAC